MPVALSSSKQRALLSKTAAASPKAASYTNDPSRESFDEIYLDLSREAGKCRFAETGFGWKPSGGGDTFTLDASNIGAAQWSRAAKGFEVKIMQRNSGVVQLDGFKQEVRCSSRILLCAGRMKSAF